MATAESKFMDVISDRTDVLKILPEAAARALHRAVQKLACGYLYYP